MSARPEKCTAACLKKQKQKKYKNRSSYGIKSGNTKKCADWGQQQTTTATAENAELDLFPFVREYKMYGIVV